MAGGHSFNSFLDYAWTGLDRGEKENRSAEKSYTGGQNLIENGAVSLREVLINALVYYALALVPIIYLSVHVSWWLLPIAVCGMLMTFMYSWGKFTIWAHELSLGLAVGPVAVLIGMFAVNPNPPIVNGILVSVPTAIILSFLGLALDEWPDAEANLKKGVKSLAYKVWEYSEWSGYSHIPSGPSEVDCERTKSLGLLRWYCTAWLMFMCIYHVLLITLGILMPLTALAMVVVPVCVGLLVTMERDFQKSMIAIVAAGALYPIIILVGQILG
ncbi:MAG: prenyltransferase [Dehalococcoidales bacterium]|nr:prenyltransferase [Dehalococcoidales bacterium]